MIPFFFVMFHLIVLGYKMLVYKMLLTKMLCQYALKSSSSLIISHYPPFNYCQFYISHHYFSLPSLCLQISNNVFSYLSFSLSIIPSPIFPSLDTQKLLKNKVNEKVMGTLEGAENEYNELNKKKHVRYL